MSSGPDGAWLAALATELPRHAAIIDGLRRSIDGDELCRWLTVGCSLGSGRGDQLSDIDAGIGYTEPLEVDELEKLGLAHVDSAGAVTDVLVHLLDGWPASTRRFAAEFDSGVQLDLVLIPAALRTGLPPGEVAVTDKDGVLVVPMTPSKFQPPDRKDLREWVMLGWWAVSDIAKYVLRGSLFEAAARIDAVRQQALRLHAAAAGIPYAAFGLTSLLDYPPYELPDDLTATYCVPDDRQSVVRAAIAVAALLAGATAAAGTALGHDLSTPWATTSRQRLDEV